MKWPRGTSLRRFTAKWSNDELYAPEQGDVDGAIKRLADALEVARRAYGDRHATVVTMRNNRAAMLRSVGRLEEAEAEARAAVAAASAGLGQAHHLVGVARLGLGAVLLERANVAAAVDEIAAAQAILTAALGPTHQDTALARAALADALRQAGRLAEARTEAEAAWAVGEQAFPPAHPRLGKLRLVVAQTSAALGECDAARFAAAADDLARGGAPMRTDLAWALLGEGRCLAAIGDTAGARARRDEAAALLGALPYAPPALAQALAAP